MLIFWTVCAALGAFWATEIVKVVLPWTLQSWTKMISSALAAAVLLWGTRSGHTASEMALANVGAAGLAVVVHRLHRFLGAAGDDHRTSVMARGVGRQR